MLLKTKTCLIWILLAFVISSCSNSGGGGGGTPGQQNPNDALNKLSPQDKQRFETWQNKIFKTCDATSIFTDNGSSDSSAIDLNLFLKANSNSLIFSDNGNLTIITGIKKYSGMATSKYYITLTVDGAAQYELKAETKVEDSKCILILNGQKVFEALIAGGLEIGVDLDAQTVNSLKTQTKVPEVVKLGSYGTIDGGAIFSLIKQALEPNEDTIARLEKKFGLSKDQGRNFFSLSTGSSVFSMSMNSGFPVWTDSSDARIIDGESRLVNVVQGNTNLPLEVRVGIPQISVGDLSNKTDAGTMQFLAELSLVKQNENLNIAIQKLEATQIQPFEKLEAFQCLAHRVSSLSALVNSPQQVYPWVDGLMRPCEEFYPNLSQEAYDSGVMSGFIPEIFAHIIPNSVVEYGGWRQVLSKLAMSSVAKGEDVAKLDPNSRTLIVPTIAKYFNSLTGALEKTHNLSDKKETLYSMTLDWSFEGQSVEGSRIYDIVLALDNSVDPFKSSSQNLINGLGQHADGFDNDIVFAKNISDDYKNEARKAIALAGSLNYSSYEQDFLYEVIQKKPTLDELRKNTEDLEKVQPQISKYPKLEKVRASLMYASLKGLKRGDVLPNDFEQIYLALSNVIEPFATSTENLIKSMYQSIKNQSETLQWASTVTPEYKVIAGDMYELSKKLNYESWAKDKFDNVLQNKTSLEMMRAWRGMWIAANSFAEREKKRVSADNMYAQNEFKYFLSHAVDEIWQNSEFIGAEKISELGKYRNVCENNKDVSSLVTCMGIAALSNQDGMLLDPKYHNRYVEFSSVLEGYLKRLSAENYFSLRTTLLNTYWNTNNPMWSRCADAEFQSRSNQLSSLVEKIVTSSDTGTQWDIERQINKLLYNCN